MTEQASRDDRLSSLEEQLEAVLERAQSYEERYAAQLGGLHARQKRGGTNLLHYLALRQSDSQELQEGLSRFGLSSLEGTEAHVAASLEAILSAVRHLRGSAWLPERPSLSVERGRARIRRHTTRLLGPKNEGAPIRIMVTLPTEAADDYDLVLGLVRAGMNCARINCAHDGPAVWEKMIEHVHQARDAMDRSCKVFMDLAGPKIRVGEIAPGPGVLKITPKRDVRGQVTGPRRVLIVSDDGAASKSDGVRLPVTPDLHVRMGPGHRLMIVDARGEIGSFEIESDDAGARVAHVTSTIYLEEGLEAVLLGADGEEIGRGVVGALPTPRPHILLRTGDTLVLHKDVRPGEPAIPASATHGPTPAHISCSIPQIVDTLEVGQPVFFDDGKIKGVVRERNAHEAIIEIERAGLKGTKLRGNKGLNLPETSLGLFGLTDKDREDLPFVVQHADGVNVSYINHPDDVEDLLDALDTLGGGHLGVVLKIETRAAVANLPGILLASMEWPSVGVMIARGDLAIEAGWARLAEVQEEILRVCEAAHIPTIWATEVLDRLAKKGVPTRGEVSDVVMAGRAECVMLNKGPYITVAIRGLDLVLSSLQKYRKKEGTRMPALQLELPDREEVGRAIGDRRGRWENG
jgi:pyruvate kinase